MAMAEGSSHAFVYIVRCADGSLYTGVARDVERRIRQHNDGKGARYTAGRQPVSLLYCEPQVDWSAALKREIAIKRMTRKSKLRLIKVAGAGPGVRG